MSVFVDCQKSRDGVEYRPSRAGRRRGATYWTCLVVLAGLCRSASAAAADGGVPPAAAEASPFGRLMNLLSGTSDEPAVPPRGNSKLPTIGTSGGLVSEQEKSEDYQQIVADSLYPPTAAPEKLNADPHGEAWLVKVRMTEPGETAQLLSAAEYEAYAGAE